MAPIVHRIQILVCLMILIGASHILHSSFISQKCRNRVSIYGSGWLCSIESIREERIPTGSSAFEPSKCLAACSCSCTGVYGCHHAGMWHLERSVSVWGYEITWFQCLWLVDGSRSCALISWWLTFAHPYMCLLVGDLHCVCDQTRNYIMNFAATNVLT